MRASALWCVSALHAADPSSRSAYLVEAGGETGIEVASSRADVDTARLPLRTALFQLVATAEDPLQFDVGIGQPSSAAQAPEQDAKEVAAGAFANPGGRVDFTRGLQHIGFSELHPDATSLLAAAFISYGEYHKKYIPHLVVDEGKGYAQGDWDQEWAFLLEMQDSAKKLLEASGWKLADRIGVGGDDVEHNDDTPGIFYDVYTRTRYSDGPSPREDGLPVEFLVAFRGTEGDADYADNWKNLLPQMLGSALPRGFKKGYIQHVDGGADLEEEDTFSNSFWEFAMQVGNSVQGFTRYYDAKLAKYTKVSREKIDRNGYLGFLPQVLDDLVTRFGLVSASQLYLTGHSAGAVRAEAFADLVKVRLANCPFVMVFSAPGSCAAFEVARACNAIEVGHGVDWYSTAVEGPPEHRTRYAIVLTQPQKKRIHDYCAFIAGHGMGKLVLNDAARFQACRYLTHEILGLWETLHVHPQPVQLDALPTNVVCGQRGWTNDTVRWTVFFAIVLLVLFVSIVGCCIAAGCTDMLTEVCLQAKQKCAGGDLSGGAAAQ